jgi:hypothetical protein
VEDEKETQYVKEDGRREELIEITFMMLLKYPYKTDEGY